MTTYHTVAALSTGKIENFQETKKNRPGQLIHADEDGFLVIPDKNRTQLFQAVRFVDADERKTVTAAARETRSKPIEKTLETIDKACRKF